MGQIVKGLKLWGMFLREKGEGWFYRSWKSSNSGVLRRGTGGSGVGRGKAGKVEGGWAIVKARATPGNPASKK